MRGKYDKKKCVLVQKHWLIFVLVILVLGTTYFLLSGGNNTKDVVRTILRLAKRRCLKDIYKDFLLVISYDEPYYKDNDFIRDIYKDIFGKVVICGPEPNAHSGRFVPDIEFENANGLYGYNCLGKAIMKYEDGGYSGYFFTSYDVVLNWWNLNKFDTKKIWMLDQDPQLQYKKLKTSDVAHCQNYRTFLRRISSTAKFKRFWENYYKNMPRGGEERCAARPSRFFYIPREFSNSFSMLSNSAYMNRLDQMFAVPNIVQSLQRTENIETVPEFYKPPQYRHQTSPQFWSEYTPHMTVTHSFRLYRKDSFYWNHNKKVLNEKFVRLSKQLVDC